MNKKTEIKRKFYKTVIQVEVLSEEPFEYNDLSDVHEQITYEYCSGRYSTVEVKTLTGRQAAKALLGQGSEPEFFLIDENGEDL
jgi:hypothetical protein